MYVLNYNFLQAWRRRAVCMFLRLIGWSSLTACSLLTPWWSSCWMWVKGRFPAAPTNQLSTVLPPPLSVCLQLLEEPVEVIGNALELRAFDRMEEDIRLIGYFKNEDSERECVRPSAWLMCFLLSEHSIRTLFDESMLASLWLMPFIITWVHFNPLISMDLQIHFYHCCTHSCHCLVPSHMLWMNWV